MIMATVLAAGTSSRMGKKNKLALEWGNSTVLETTMKVVEQVGFDKRMIVLGYECDYWLSRWEEKLTYNVMKWDTYVNINYSKGQGTSVAVAAENLTLNFAYRDCEAAVFFLGDQPLVRPDTVKMLIEKWRQDPERIIVPTYEGQRGNPVIFPKWCFPEMAKLTADEGARGLFEAHSDKVVFVPTDDRGIAVDLDTEEAYRKEVQNVNID